MDRDAAQQHLRYLFNDLADDERVEARAFTKGDVERDYFSAFDPIMDWAEAREILSDVYVGVLPRRAGAGGTNAAVSRFTCIWLDLDFKNGHDEASRRQQLVDLGMVPTILVRSGGGLHAYWMFTEPMPKSKATVRQCQAVMKHLASELNCDRTADPARILRLAGTLNHKYGEPLPVLIENSGPRRPYEEILRGLGPNVTELAEHVDRKAALQVVGDPPENTGDVSIMQPSRWDLVVMEGLPEQGGNFHGYEFEGRNKAMYIWACRRRDEGCPEWMTVTMALGFNKRNLPPMPDDEVMRTVHSAYSHEPEIAQVAESTQGNATQEQGAQQRRLVTFYEDLADPQPVTWLNDYIPLGRLMLLDGEEGIGKGLFCALTAATYADKGVLWMAAEDDPSDDIRPRVRSAAAHLGTAVPKECIGFIDPNLKFNSAEPREFEILRDIVTAQKPSLLIMDPGRSFIRPRADAREFSNNAEADIRPTLELLARCARAWNVALLFVHHWNKAFGSPTKYRTTGSGAYRQVARHVVSLARDDETGDGAYAVTKSNISDLGKLQGYLLEEIDGWPVFIPTGGIEGVESFETWYRRPKTRVEVDTPDPAEVLREYCDRTFQPGEQLPEREVLRRAIGLSQPAIKAAAVQLREEGWIRVLSNARFWVGKPESPGR